MPRVKSPETTLYKCLGRLSPPLPACGDDESVGSSRGYQLADDGEGDAHEPPK